MKDIERPDLISTRYLSEIDEAHVSTLNLCPSFAISAFMVLHLSGALTFFRPNVIRWIANEATAGLVVHGLIFHFICDDVQQKTLRSLIFSFIAPEAKPLLLDFLRNPNVRSMTQRTTEHTTLLPSAVFHIFSIVG